MKCEKDSLYFIVATATDPIAKEGVIMGFMYKGFESSNIKEENGIYSGTVENSADYLEFSGSDIQDCKDKFKIIIDKYIKECEEIGKNPIL
jgi:predicted HicB family RNase H-like nuclease